MKTLLKPILAIIIFLLAQGFVSLSAKWIAPSMTPTLLAASLIVSGLITILILRQMRMIRPSTLHPWRISWRYVHLGIIAVFLGIFAADVLCSMLHLPDFMESQFMSLAQNPLGILAIVFIGPITEEVVFRESVLGYMLLHDIGRWKAIFFSALLFSLIHLNPVQIPFAFITGILLGIVYAKSRSILLTSSIHILNNAMAVIEMNILGENHADFDIVKILGGQLFALAFFVGCAMLCIIFTREFIHKYHRPAARHHRHRR